ncbi:ribosome-associated translation inhibitor RaiA [Patescibacteria group bacterium]|nr:ribosome-associated translation inhibitor RaiA [Patescibacteria group bacterium]
MKIQIHNQNFDLTQAFQQYLEEKISALEKYQENIISFQVYLGRDTHHKKGEVYSVEVIASMPGQKNIIVKETDSDARRAVDIVQDKMARQIVKSKEKKVSRLRKTTRYFKSLKFWNKNHQ